MDGYSFSEILSYQTANTKIVNYENEFLFMLGIKNDGNFDLRRRMSSAWLNALKVKNASNGVSNDNATRIAIRLREEGNAFYSSKADGKQKNLIIAGQRYTQAIFTAHANTEALALSYANRAMVLQELGYYQQAYDDCCCALETNQYPLRLVHKIKTRQAFCALYLKDTKQLAVHLEELENCNLNDSFIQRLQELQVGLKSQINEIRMQPELKEISQEMANSEATIAVDEKSATRGRYMIATKDIGSGEVIFSETASSFVPVGGCQMCQQCGAMLIIPIPCHGCNGQVVYCSLKCGKIHSSLHQNECVGYRIGLFEQIGISHLALRVILEELPGVVPLFEHETDVRQLWLDLTAAKEFINAKNGLKYVQTLRMVSHLSKMPLPDIIWFALVADLLVMYLKEYTYFFNSMKNSKLKQCDWELVTSALILRHIGQFIVNAHTCVSITPTCHDELSTANTFGFLLAPDVWTKPFHLCRGKLHVLSEFREVSAANLPYLSICNHACAPTLRPKFSGKNFYALAETDIEKGAEIFNCYTLNYRKSLRDVRRSYLRDIYHFDCTCVQCQRKDPDAAYLKYHLYKCQNADCRKEFVPIVNQSSTLNWWQTEGDKNVPLEVVSCPVCKKKQDTAWYIEFKELLKNTNSAENRARFFRIFKLVDDFLLEFHSLKLLLALELVNACILSYNGGCEFTDSELSQIVHILKFCLRGTADQCGIQSIEYVVTMTFMWDLIALGKCQCTQQEKTAMLEALHIISDEYRLVFENYYNDYIDIK
ncbi:SET and MYND domain-containing protein 4 [Anastrepha ludens]|uniref:SET and MYND domain-containing protein 4 n=1 Tax=Anastrepha ludens TaxID=28586 RepID=UPI0023B02A7D|nr:SET and MYND domain-containing protein 4 [Anastrepha ludens]XP_053965059.1 SET and MYND domain-containing protein 4 [Anastrepha ludens]XP_053965060.1 SET and MYND domain-containing protein 4 [Anastrepha ludens]